VSSFRASFLRANSSSRSVCSFSSPSGLSTFCSFAKYFMPTVRTSDTSCFHSLSTTCVNLVLLHLADVRLEISSNTLRLSFRCSPAVWKLRCPKYVGAVPSSKVLSAVMS